jgi:hypothetical protein
MNADGKKWTRKNYILERMNVARLMEKCYKNSVF